MATTDRYREIADVPARIGLFPLRGAILLPRSTLPLNVFEPRYLQLVDDALSGSRVLGIIQPERSGTEDESPAGKAFGLRHVGGAGRITSFQEQDDGRILITLTGICRFRLGAEVETRKLYRTFDVAYASFAGDLAAGAGEDRIDRQALLGALRRFLDARRMRADWNAVANAPSEHLVNMLATISPYGPEEKQALLEAADLKTRADVLIALVEMDLASGESGSGSTLQ
jgi:hypothetical protein